MRHWQISRGQPGGGVVGEQLAQQRCEARGWWRGVGLGGGGIERAALAIGVGGAVERFDRTQQSTGARIDQIDTAQVPAGVAQMHALEVAIARGDLEAPAGQAHGAIAAAQAASALDAKGAQQFGRRGTGTREVGAGEIARQRRLSDLGVVGAMVFLLDPGLGGFIEQGEGQPRLSPSSMAMRRPSMRPRNDSCLAFW